MRKDPVEPEVLAAMDEAFERVTEQVVGDLCAVKAHVVGRMRRAMAKGDVTPGSYRTRDNIAEAIEECEDGAAYLLMEAIRLRELQRTIGSRRGRNVKSS
jgi:uncharacterized Ntn-hydrolase superfamily protein